MIEPIVKPRRKNPCAGRGCRRPSRARSRDPRIYEGRGQGRPPFMLPALRACGSSFIRRAMRAYCLLPIRLAARRGAARVVRNHDANPDGLNSASVRMARRRSDGSGLNGKHLMRLRRGGPVVMSFQLDKSGRPWPCASDRGPEMRTKGMGEMKPSRNSGALWDERADIAARKRWPRGRGRESIGSSVSPNVEAVPRRGCIARAGGCPGRPLVSAREVGR